jgi:hypothetical protein
MLISLQPVQSLGTCTVVFIVAARMLMWHVWVALLLLLPPGYMVKVPEVCELWSCAVACKCTVLYT